MLLIPQKQFLDLAQQLNTKLLCFYRNQKTRDLERELVNFEEFKKYHRDCVDCRVDFDGTFLKMYIYWEEDDLISGIPIIYGIEV